MIPSTGGDHPPDQTPSPVTPAVPNLANESISRRISTRSGANKKIDIVEGGLGKSSSGTSIPVTKGTLKTSKAGKSRQPLANLSMQDLNRGESLFNSAEIPEQFPLHHSDLNRNIEEAMEVEPTPSATGESPVTSVSVDAAVLAINQPESAPQGLVTPLKSPCTLNAAPVSIPTPGRNIDFDMVVDNVAGDPDVEITGVGGMGGPESVATGQTSESTPVVVNLEGNQNADNTARPHFNVWNNTQHRSDRGREMVVDGGVTRS